MKKVNTNAELKSLANPKNEELYTLNSNGDLKKME